MLILFALFGAFVAFIAWAPKEVMQFSLVAVWAILAAGCTASVLSVAVR